MRCQIEQTDPGRTVARFDDGFWRREVEGDEFVLHVGAAPLVDRR
jgi:hypothetical protein